MFLSLLMALIFFQPQQITFELLIQVATFLYLLVPYSTPYSGIYIPCTAVCMELEC